VPLCVNKPLTSSGDYWPIVARSNTFVMAGSPYSAAGMDDEVGHDLRRSSPVCVAAEHDDLPVCVLPRDHLEHLPHRPVRVPVEVSVIRGAPAVPRRF
jgi:hypothetical protein